MGAGSGWSPGVCGSTGAGGEDPKGIGARGPSPSDEEMTSPMTTAVWQSSGCVGHCEGSITSVRDRHWAKLQPEALRQSPIRPVASFDRVSRIAAPSRAVARLAIHRLTSTIPTAIANVVPKSACSDLTLLSNSEDFRRRSPYLAPSAMSLRFPLVSQSAPLHAMLR